MGMVHGLQKGTIKPSDVSTKVKKAADSMSDKDAEDYASTKHKGLPKKVKEAFLSENPAASAAAAMVMMQMQNPDTGKKIKAITPLKNKDHKLHSKAKGIFKRLKDKISKKKDKPTDKASQYRALMQKQKDYKREEVEEGFGGELKGSDRKKFEKARKENAEVLGYKLTGTKDIKESVNEKKNPKREKVKKDFLKSLQTLEKRVKRIKQFAKSNQWGPVSSFVEDGLVYDLRDLEREIDQIISMPVDESINEGKVEPKVKSQLNVLAKRLTDLKRADTQLEKSMWEVVMEYTKIYNMVKDGKYFETAGFKQLPGSLELNHKRFSQKFSKSLDSIIKSTKDSVKRLQLKESVNEATSLGADMLLGGLAQVVRKAGMKPKTAKMMGGGFKVSKRDKVGFKMDVEIRGRDKKQTHKLQFEMERGMLYVIIKNKPVKLGKYTMVNPTAQNLKKVGSALIGETVNEAFVNNLKQAMSYINTDTKDGKEFMKLMKQKSYTKQQGIRAMTLAMRGSAIHGAGPGGVSQFTMHIAKNVKGLK